MGIIVLLIDVCGTVSSLALADVAEEVVIATAELPGRHAAERLVAAVRALLAEAGVGMASIGAVGVVHGPGSFTGVRVGLSAAKGLSEAWGVPLVAVSRLAVLAGMSAGETIFPVMDAGRGEFYCGEYRLGVCLGESLRTGVEIVAAVGAGMVVAYEPAVAEVLAGLISGMRVSMVAEPMAADALALMVDRVRAGSFDDVASIDANYVRRTDAEIFAKPATKPDGGAGLGVAAGLG